MSECWKCKKKFKEEQLTWTNFKQIFKLLCDKCREGEEITSS